MTKVFVFIFAWVTTSEAMAHTFSPKNFIDLEYEGASPNTVSITDSITIDVKNSGSPLFYKFDSAVRSIELEGTISKINLPHLPNDDAYLSIGVVYPGDIRPSFLERLFIPNWVLKILSIVPEGGVSHIEFHDVAPLGHSIDYKRFLGGIPVQRKARSFFAKDGTFHLNIDVPSSNALGLWIRSDGDETNSKFKITIHKMELKSLNNT